jgi:OOP family OmpA-OmpF porin
MATAPLVLGLGAFSVVLLGLAAGHINGPRFTDSLERQAEDAIAAAGGAPIVAEFRSPNGFPTRHPWLSGGEGLNEGVRDDVAKAVAAVPGVGGIRWTDGSAFADAARQQDRPVVCQEDVDALLRARTIRFDEASSNIEATSRTLVDEVASALRPCLGSIIAITGHTDASGPEPGNLELSLLRAEAVRQALVRRGIPSDGLRIRGVGSRFPVTGLEPDDPANRRIEFSVVATAAVRPTPVDTPGPR